MKITNSRSIFSEQKNDGCQANNKSGQGITKRLLEKYSPKGIHNVERMKSGKEKKRVA